MQGEKYFLYPLTVRNGDSNVPSIPDVHVTHAWPP